jgi:hypothetical protein
VAQRAQALFALDRGERIGAMVHWLGWSRTGRWELWQRDHAWGIDAAFEAARSGRPPVFSPLQRVQIERVACTAPPASGLQRARGDCRSLHEVVVEQAIGGSIHYPTVARILAQARLQPPRRRSWKTATIDERFLTQAAKMGWRYERVHGATTGVTWCGVWRRHPRSRCWCGGCRRRRCALGSSRGGSASISEKGQSRAGRR